MQPGPAASAIQVTSCGMGAKTAPRGADHLVQRGTTAPCRTGHARRARLSAAVKPARGAAPWTATMQTRVCPTS